MTPEIRIYRFLLYLLSPILFVWLLREAWQHKSWQHLLARLGKTDPIQADIWLHCASVGEVNAAAPLVHALHQQGKRLLITTFTPTGQQQAERRFAILSNVHMRRLPFDWQWTVNRFLSRIDCPQLWLVETEFWANLILSAHNKGIQLRLINARITHKTLHSPAWWRRLLVHLLDTHITQIFCRHAQDVQDFRTLGVTGSHIHAIGNLKWCDDQTPPVQRLLDNPYVVFASTHEPEELELARRWQQHPELPQLVIVPRHPKRGTAIMKQFASAGIEAVQRSQSTTHDSKSIMLADTFGELISWMAYSELVIMGGSFAPKSGQNPLEAIRLGKCVLCGSDMRDFAEEVQALTPTGAIMSVDNMDHLIDAVIQQLQHPQILHEHGMEGKSWLIEHSRDILRHYL